MFAAQRAGTTVAGFGTATRGLISALRAAEQTPTGEQAQAFREMGVEIHDAEGNLRNLNDILMDIRPIFEDLRQQGLSTEASRLANVLFGARGGQGFINFLSTSREELDALIATAHEVGAVIPENELTNAERMTDILLGLENAAGSARAAIGNMITEEFGEDLERFTRWIVTNRQAIADWVKDVVQTVARIGRQLSDFLFGQEQLDEFGQRIGRTQGFIEKVVNVITPIAAAIQGIVDLIGGWENAILVIVGLFAAKLVLAVASVALGITQLGVGIAAMVASGAVGIGRLIGRFMGLTRAANTAAAATAVATGAGTVAAPAAGAGLGRFASGLLAGARMVGAPAVAAGIMLTPTPTNRGNNEFEVEEERSHLERQRFSDEQIDLLIRARGGAGLQELTEMPAAAGLTHQEISDLLRSADQFGTADRIDEEAIGAALGEHLGGALRDHIEPGADTIQDAADLMNEAARRDVSAAEALERAAADPPRGQVDVRIHVDADGNVRSRATASGGGVGTVITNDGIDTPAWALTRTLRLLPEN